MFDIIAGYFDTREILQAYAIPLPSFPVSEFIYKDWNFLRLKFWMNIHQTGPISFHSPVMASVPIEEEW